MRGVIEHNRKPEVHSAGETLAALAPPILRWQAANGGSLQWWMLMPNSGPRGLAPFPKHKQRRSAKVHAWQLPFTPTRARENKGINHWRVVGFLPTSFAALSLRGSSAPGAPVQAAPASIFPFFSSHSYSWLSLNKSLYKDAHALLMPIKCCCTARTSGQQEPKTLLIKCCI